MVLRLPEIRVFWWFETHWLRTARRRKARHLIGHATKHGNFLFKTRQPCLLDSVLITKTIQSNVGFRSIRFWLKLCRRSHPCCRSAPGTWSCPISRKHYSRPWAPAPYPITPFIPQDHLLIMVYRVTHFKEEPCGFSSVNQLTDFGKGLM